MSKNRNRTASKNCTQNRWYNIADFQWGFSPWDEDYWCRYPAYRKGFKNSQKQLYSYQVRQFRSWKHNRKTQYK